MKNLDRKPAANVRPIKHTQVHDISARNVNVDPVFTGVGMIGREGSRVISGRSITQEIPGRKVITHGNIITTDITDTRKIPFEKRRRRLFFDQRKADKDVHVCISGQSPSYY